MPSDKAYKCAAKIMSTAGDFVKACTGSPLYAAELVKDAADRIDAHAAEAHAVINELVEAGDYLLDDMRLRSVPTNCIEKMVRALATAKAFQEKVR